MGGVPERGKAWAALGWALALVCACPGPGRAAGLSPFYGKVYLVAGSGERGFKDGDFLHARFREPCDLALSQDGSTLYVVDRANHALRAVALDQADRVSTLIGDGRPGSADGVAAAASLAHPSQVLATPDGAGLLLLDQDGHSIRRYGLSTRRLETLVPARAGLVYSAISWDSITGTLYAVSGDGLYRWDGPAGRLKSLGHSPDLVCPEGRLFFLKGDGFKGDYSPSIGFYFNPCAGRIFCLKLPTPRLLESLSWQRRLSAHMELTQMDGGALSRTATGFCGGPTEVRFWDEGHGGLGSFDPRSRVHYHALSDYLGGSLEGRRILGCPLAMQAGPDKRIYVADPASCRVLGLDGNLDFDDATEAGAVRMSEPKPAGVWRVMVVGSSLTFYWVQNGPADAYNVHLSFVRQLESWLNLDGALQGSGRRYEVLSLSRQLGDMNGGTDTYFLQQAEAFKKHQVDEALLVIDYMSLCKELQAFALGLTQDDMALVDPKHAAWEGMTGKERTAELGPLSRAFVDYVRDHPRECEGWVGFDPNGWISFKRRDREMLEFPPFKKFAVALMRKTLGRCRDQARAQGLRLSVVLWPTRDLVELGEGGGDDCYDRINAAEMDAPLQRICASLGLRCYALTDEARLVEPDFYPLVQWANHHYTARAQGWMAYLLARKMTQKQAEIGSH